MKQTIIYLRTSTTEQTPELQLNGCMEVVNKLKLNADDFEKLEEQKSAYKNDDKREVFNEVLKEIKHNNIRSIIVWDLDRLYRNRTKLVGFFEICKMFKCKIYSFRQQFLEDIYKAPEPWNDILFSMMVNVMGWMAEDESKKRSDRIRNAVRSVDKEGQEIKAISYKGNKWGRKEIFTNKRLVDSILKLHNDNPKMSIKEITSKTNYYDKSNNSKNPSAFLVWKIIKMNNQLNIGEKD